MKLLREVYTSYINAMASVYKFDMLVHIASIEYDRITGNVKCLFCNVHRSPTWRRGPEYRLLCNACGLQYARKPNR